MSVNVSPKPKRKLKLKLNLKKLNQTQKANILKNISKSKLEAKTEIKIDNKNTVINLDTDDLKEKSEIIILEKEKMKIDLTLKDKEDLEKKEMELWIKDQKLNISIKNNSLRENKKLYLFGNMNKNNNNYRIISSNVQFDYIISTLISNKLNKFLNLSKSFYKNILLNKNIKYLFNNYSIYFNNNNINTIINNLEYKIFKNSINLNINFNKWKNIYKKTCEEKSQSINNSPKLKLKIKNKLNDKLFIKKFIKFNKSLYVEKINQFKNKFNKFPILYFLLCYKYTNGGPLININLLEILNEYDLSVFIINIFHKRLFYKKLSLYIKNNIAFKLENKLYNKYIKLNCKDTGKIYTYLLNEDYNNFMNKYVAFFKNYPIHRSNIINGILKISQVLELDNRQLKEGKILTLQDKIKIKNDKIFNENDPDLEFDISIQPNKKSQQSKIIGQKRKLSQINDDNDNCTIKIKNTKTNDTKRRKLNNNKNNKNNNVNKKIKKFKKIVFSGGLKWDSIIVSNIEFNQFGGTRINDLNLSNKKLNVNGLIRIKPVCKFISSCQKTNKKKILFVEININDNNNKKLLEEKLKKFIHKGIVIDLEIKEKMLMYIFFSSLLLDECKIEDSNMLRKYFNNTKMRKPNTNLFGIVIIDINRFNKCKNNIKIITSNSSSVISSVSTSTVSSNTSHIIPDVKPNVPSNNNNDINNYNNYPSYPTQSSNNYNNYNNIHNQSQNQNSYPNNNNNYNNYSNYSNNNNYNDSRYYSNNNQGYGGFDNYSSGNDYHDRSNYGSYNNNNYGSYNNNNYNRSNYNDRMRSNQQRL